MANGDRATAPAVVRAVRILSYLAEHPTAEWKGLEAVVEYVDLSDGARQRKK